MSSAPVSSSNSPPDHLDSSSVSDDRLDMQNTGPPGKAPYVHVYEALSARPLPVDEPNHADDYAELMRCQHKDLDDLHAAAEIECFDIIARCAVPDLADIDQQVQVASQVPDSPLQTQVKQNFFAAMRSMQTSDLPKKQRGNLPKDAVDTFKSWFDAHLDHPYPSEEDKKTLSAATGIEVNQITNWFINYRKRVWKPTLPENHPMKGAAASRAQTHHRF